MLSLEKASVEPTGPWSLQSVSSFSGPTREDESVRLPSQVTDTLNRSADEGDIELESSPKPRIGEE